MGTLLSKPLLKSKKNKLDGYTLIELVIVITVIGIMTGTVSVSMSDLNLTARLSNATYRVLADMRYAQELAMSERRSINVYVNPGTHHYEIKYADTGAYVESPSDDGNINIFLNSGAYSGVVITSTGITSRLTFTPTGEALLGGSTFTTDTSIMLLNNQVFIAVTGGGLVTLGRRTSGGCGSSFC